MSIEEASTDNSNINSLLFIVLILTYTESYQKEITVNFKKTIQLLDLINTKITNYILILLSFELCL